MSVPWPINGYPSARRGYDKAPMAGVNCTIPIVHGVLPPPRPLSVESLGQLSDEERHDLLVDVRLRKASPAVAERVLGQDQVDARAQLLHGQRV